jgi:hypothetical protein
MKIYRVLSILTTKFGGDDFKIESQACGGPLEDMKRSYAPEKVSPGSLIPCVGAT